MSLILNIDTASETALISLAENGNLLHEERNSNQKDHASFLHPAIRAIIKKAGITFNDIEAFAVIEGPGSYTGLRVGMASAKGLCFALDKPLITIGSLEAMTADMIVQHAGLRKAHFLFCPMIDARRMEVFTAVYDMTLNMIMQPAALVLDEYSYSSLNRKQTKIFFGNGSTKWEQICPISESVFITYNKTSSGINNLSYQKFIRKEFSEINYAEPFYLKGFYTINEKEK